jgi:molybdenum-dependent DNA-binding transcriptional regulator ModE
MLLGSVDANMRMSTYARHYFIPKNARLTCTLPDLGELLELAQAYAWLGAAARRLDLEYDMETMVFAAIQAYGVHDSIERAVRGRRVDAAKGRDLLGRLLAAADELADLGTAVGVQTEAVARREYERSRRWLQRTATLRGCHVAK